jgi:hypothetical protein
MARQAPTPPVYTCAIVPYSTPATDGSGLRVWQQLQALSLVRLRSNSQCTKICQEDVPPAAFGCGSVQCMCAAGSLLYVIFNGLWLLVPVLVRNATLVVSKHVYV